MRLAPALAALLVLTIAARAQHPIVDVKVAGLVRLPAAAVIAASGLRKGQMAARTDLDAAAQRLADTGFFSSVTYGYDPRSAGGVTGYALTFHVSEQQERVRVELDIPGQDAEQLWRQIKAANPLIDQEMPNNDRASAYFQRAVEGALRKANYREELAMKTEADLATGKMTVICRPAHLPRIAAIDFEGNAAIGSHALEFAMSRVSMGQEYTERDFRRKLELNLRPLYEDLGRLTVAFPQVRMSGTGDVKVTIEINEGPVWRLGKVSIKGDSLPLADMHDAAQFAYGAAANWTQFKSALSKMQQVLLRDGYITVSSQPVRVFQETARVVDVNVEVKKGPQYLFGELHIDGLDADTEQRLASRWKLAGGAPVDQIYIDDFVRSSMSILMGKFRTSHAELHVRKEARVVDVTFQFK